MIDVNFSDLTDFIGVYNHEMEHFKPEPVFCFPYLKRVLNEQFEKLKPTLKFPMEIKLPKEEKDLLAGDFEPKQVIRLEKPIMWEDVPIWFESTMEQAYLRFGYKNLDARYISDVALSMECIHGFLGGSSGHGKSVTMNAMICGLCMEYAPWELEIHLSDAKIVEFKKYGVNHRIPHISTIAATSDSDFVVSVLQSAFDKMQMRNKIFGSVGASNLKSFRKKTGLALPRVVIIMDEVESTFKFAGKKAGRIADLIDGYARLGRSAGYHIIMATQNLTSDIPSSAMGQVKLRMCLGAVESVSEKVLGNKGAAENMGRIGRMIVNTDALNGGNTFKSNIKFQTPFLTDDNFEVEMQMLEEKGKEVGYVKNLSFYDEEDIKTIEETCKMISSTQEKMKARGEMTSEVCPVILGTPAFVTTDVDELLKIYLDNEDVENIAITSPTASKLGVLLKTLSENLKAQYMIYNVTSKADYLKMFPENSINRESKSVFTNNFAVVSYLVNQGLFMDAVDSLSKTLTLTDAMIQAANQYFTANSLTDFIDNEYMIRRYQIFSDFKKYVDYKDIYESISKYFPDFTHFSKLHILSNITQRWIEKKDFSKKVIFIGDVNKIVGLGRDSKTKEIDRLKKLMQDCYKVNILFVLYGTTFTDLQSLSSGIRYVVFDSVDTREYGKFKVEDPGEVNAVLCALYDSVADGEKIKKFKRSKIKS